MRYDPVFQKASLVNGGYWEAILQHTFQIASALLSAPPYSARAHTLVTTGS